MMNHKKYEKVLILLETILILSGIYAVYYLLMGDVALPFGYGIVASALILACYTVIDYYLEKRKTPKKELEL